MAGLMDRTYGLVLRGGGIALKVVGWVSPGAARGIARLVAAGTAPLRRAWYQVRIRAWSRRALQRARAGQVGFPEPGASPAVSVVVLGAGAPERAILCLEALARTGCQRAFEVLLVCGELAGETGRLVGRISNLRWLPAVAGSSSAARVGQGVEAARGPLVALLDTEVVVGAGFLDALVECLEARPEAGLVGAKVLSRDGLVWDGGGIVWRDGSTESYGRGRMPDGPETSYRKEVDAVWWPGMLMRREEWERAAGKEGWPAPEECLGLELAFRVRSGGRKVYYEPHAVATWLPGGVPGAATGESAAAVRQEWLLSRWGAVLAREQPPRGQDLYAVRDRSGGRRSILVIDYQVPQYDREAGGRTTMQYVRLFLEGGLTVKYLAANLYRGEPYASQLEDLGVEVVCGPRVGPRGEDWLEQAGRRLDYVFLNRPDEAKAYLPLLRRHTRARILYYGHDLHYVRLQRMYAMSGNRKELAESQRFRAVETEVVKAVEVAYFPSQVEVDQLRQEAPGANVRLLPPYLFAEPPPGPRPPWGARRGLLFVGGFRHGPNTDAVLWFAREVLPLIQRQLPDVEWTLVGQQPPPEVRALAGERVQVVGYVSDQELQGYYDRCRVVVVPLRCGAGIKGKVVEALHQGVPVVTTDVGAEGMPAAEPVLLVANDAERFAESVCQVYNSEAQWTACAHQGASYVREHFSPAGARRALQPYIVELAVAPRGGGRASRGSGEDRGG